MLSHELMRAKTQTSGHFAPDWILKIYNIDISCFFVMDFFLLTSLIMVIESPYWTQNDRLDKIFKQNIYMDIVRWIFFSLSTKNTDINKFLWISVKKQTKVWDLPVGNSPPKKTYLLLELTRNVLINIQFNKIITKCPIVFLLTDARNMASASWIFFNSAFFLYMSERV